MGLGFAWSRRGLGRSPICHNADLIPTFIASLVPGAIGGAAAGGLGAGISGAGVGGIAAGGSFGAVTGLAGGAAAQGLSLAGASTAVHAIGSGLGGSAAGLGFAAATGQNVTWGDAALGMELGVAGGLVSSYSMKAIQAGPESIEQSRLQFIGFYLQPTQRFELGGLILASANARLLENPREDTRLLQEFIGSHLGEFTVEAEYWQNLMDPEQFPLGTLLRLWDLRGDAAR